MVNTAVTHTARKADSNRSKTRPGIWVTLTSSMVGQVIRWTSTTPKVPTAEKTTML